MKKKKMGIFKKIAIVFLSLFVLLFIYVNKQVSEAEKKYQKINPEIGAYIDAALLECNEESNNIEKCIEILVKHGIRGCGYVNKLCFEDFLNKYFSKVCGNNSDCLKGAEYGISSAEASYAWKKLLK